MPGSVSVVVSATADVMGPSIEGLDHLVRLPTGCGEQNMLTFAPMISVRKYFDVKGGMDAALEAKTIKYMTTGYQRELTYRRTDGGFSAFGERDDSSSLWLSAFVLRCFANAEVYVFIDPQVLLDTAAYVTGKQDGRTGKFPPVGRVIHTDMKGGTAGSDIALTAYITLSLIDAVKALGQSSGVSVSQMKPHRVAIKKGLGFLQAAMMNEEASIYGSTLLAYVLARGGHSYAKKAMANMMTHAVDADGALYWKTKETTKDVEATAYALLALLEAQDLATAFRAMKWLVQKRSSIGGYGSTQNTIVALEALSLYAAETMGAQGDIAVRITDGMLFDETLALTAASLSRNINQTGVTSGFEMCFCYFYGIPARLVPESQPKHASKPDSVIKNFKPPFIYDCFFFRATLVCCRRRAFLILQTHPRQRSPSWLWGQASASSVPPWPGTKKRFRLLALRS